MKSVFWKAPILKAVLVRAALCACIGIVALFWLVDLRSCSSDVAGELPGRERPAADTGWPHLRGPNYDAVCVNTELANAWPAEGPPMLWNREVGAGYSSLIVVGNRAYTLTQNLTTQKVLALDADTGRTIWEHNYEWPYDPGGMYPGPRATPTYARGHIYIASPDGLVECLNPNDGKPLWSVNVNKRFDGHGTEFGYSCSPLVEDGKVILPVGGPKASMVALDAETGATVWTSGNDQASYCSALPITYRGRRQVVAFMQHELDGFDLATGRLLWRAEYSHGYDEHANFPLYDEPYLHVMLAFRGGSDLYRIEPPVAAASDRTNWSLKLVRHDQKMSNDVASSVLIDGYVYGFDLRDIQTSRHRPSRGEFRCMDFKTGEIRWSSKKPGQAMIVVARSPTSKQPAATPPKMLLFNDRGEVILVRANPNRYEELARTEVFSGEICWSAPALDRGRLYLRSPTRAACLYVGEPGQMSRRQRGVARSIASMPKSHRVDLGWLLGAERECPFELPGIGELLRWYLWSLAALAAAWLIAVSVRIAASRIFPCRRISRTVFWLAILVLGVVATPLANCHSTEFVLTWPVSLFAVHQLAIIAVLQSGQPQRRRLNACVGVAGVVLLVGSAFAYYQLTRALSLAPAWYFLLTFLPAWPVAVPAARRQHRPGNETTDAIWFLIAFSLYFWLAAGLLLGRTAIGR